MTKPVVLVHGAWHGSWCFSKLITELEARNVCVQAIDLPGHAPGMGELSDLAGDAARVSEAVAAIQGPVILLGHSYGGAVITQAACDPSTAAKIDRLVYLCAIMVPPGKTMYDLPIDHSESLLGPLIQWGENGVATINTSDASAAKAAFYGDCSDDDVAFAAAHLCPQPMANLATPVEGDPLASIAATYIRCTEDRTIPLTAQDIMIASVADNAKQLDVASLGASHSPFLSMPGALAELLAGLATA